jgi:4-alpha-glucanotransferase
MRTGAAESPQSATSKGPVFDKTNERARELTTPPPRAAGILLHPTSLPSPHGIGDLGADALTFVDRLAEMGVRYWQMLPLGPTGYGDSPYQCFSAFAGNPLLIAVSGLGGTFPEHAVDFGAVLPHKRALLARAVSAFIPDARFRAFVEAESAWLEDYALFMALKEHHDGAPWTDWETGAALRDPEALAAWRVTLAPVLERHRIEQYLFFTQLRALRTACAARGVQLIGDLPIYVAHDSADVWANRSLFQLHEDGRLAVQAGVPPDYFSATGQLWGNPLYDWPAMAEHGYAWWIARARAAFRQFDIVRIDHFRGFASYWEVAGDAQTAVNGRWVDGPGDALFLAIHNALGPLPIIAENLGLITPEVEALRERWGFPGMAILQFAFDPGATDSAFLPHNFERALVVYTGTHDNDTTVGWFALAEDAASTLDPVAAKAERSRALQYLDADGREPHWAMIRAAIASVAHTAIIPMQDLLGLGSEARMNVPGRTSGNWGFRFSWDQLTPEVRERFRTMLTLYGRATGPTAGERPV